MRKYLSSIIFVLITISLTVFLISLFSKDTFAANVLTNPSFTGGATNWTLSGGVTYQSGTYQDSAGSLRGAATGRKTTTTGTADQTISTTIIGGSTVNLNLYWAKQCVAVNCEWNEIYIQISYNGGTYQDVWSNTSNPAFGSMTSWTQVSNSNISSYFTSTGTYAIRFYSNMRTGNNGSAAAYGWIDNLNLDVTPPNITVGTTGTQTSQLPQGNNNAYIGGAFTFVRNAGSTSVTSITVSETGTITDANISGLILYYKQEATCSTSIPSGTTQFNSSPGSFSSGSSTVTGSMTVSTSQICVYVEVDIGSGASVGNTVEIQITNPSTGVTASEGTVSPATAIAISGSTSIISGGTLSIDIVDGTDTPVSNPSLTMGSKASSMVYQTSTGTLGTATEKIYMTSDSTTNWQVTIAATGGTTSLWHNAGNTRFYDFNDSTANAEDGGDTDTYGGQLSINASTGTLSPGSGCTNTGISLGNSAGFVEGSVNSVTLVTASSANIVCKWYLTGVSLSQTIPKEQAADSYSINLTLTITAI